jgi:transporter family protein
MNLTWPVWALLSAVFAALTAILAKVGVTGVPSNLATAVRTLVVLVFAIGIVLTRGEVKHLSTFTRQTWIFLGLSGLRPGCRGCAIFARCNLAPCRASPPLTNSVS